MRPDRRQMLFWAMGRVGVIARSRAPQPGESGRHKTLSNRPRRAPVPHDRRAGFRRRETAGWNPEIAFSSGQSPEECRSVNRSLKLCSRYSKPRPPAFGVPKRFQISCAMPRQRWQRLCSSSLHKYPTGGGFGVSQGRGGREAPLRGQPVNLAGVQMADQRLFIRRKSGQQGAAHVDPVWQTYGKVHHRPIATPDHPRGAEQL